MSLQHPNSPGLPSAQLRLGVGDGKTPQDLHQQPWLTPLHCPRELQAVFLQWDSLLLLALLRTLLAAVPSSGSSWHCPEDPEHPSAHMPHASLPPASQLRVLGHPTEPSGQGAGRYSEKLLQYCEEPSLR